jgi:drug/metabolite transporter (DMT)-like permease
LVCSTVNVHQAQLDLFLRFPHGSMVFHAGSHSNSGLIMFKTPLVFPHSLSGWFMIFIIGVFGLGAQVLVTMGLQREKAGRGSLAMYTQVSLFGQGRRGVSRAG